MPRFARDWRFPAPVAHAPHSEIPVGAQPGVLPSLNLAQAEQHGPLEALQQ